MNTKIQVLLLDKGNWQQSQMMERMFHDEELSERVVITSAGVEPEPEINPWVIKGMELNHQSVVKMFPKHISHFYRTQFDLIVELESAEWLANSGVQLNYLQKINVMSDFDVKFAPSFNNLNQFNVTYKELQEIVAILVAKINELTA